MNTTLLYTKINSLPKQLQQEVLDFIDFLLMKRKITKPSQGSVKEKESPKFGCAKGHYKMSSDFDEPLDDFKEYME
jgi:hypothetical protein